MNEIGIALLALACGWLGSMVQSYFSTKGKNLATKEDIQEITAKVEFVKNHFTKKHLRSKAYIERQIRAYDDIFQKLNEITKNSYQASGEIELIEEHGHTYSKDKFILARALLDKIDEHLIFISGKVCVTITDVSEGLFNLSKVEYSASLLTDAEERRGHVIMTWHTVSALVEDALFQIRGEMIDE